MMKAFRGKERFHTFRGDYVVAGKEFRQRKQIAELSLTKFYVHVENELR